MPFPETFAAVVFDLDGTLIRSEPAIIRAWTTWAIEHDVTFEQLRGCHGMPTADVVEHVLGADYRTSALARINELELAELAGIVALPGALDALEVLTAAPGHAAIATSCGAALARARLAASGVASPPVLVTVDDVARGKPAPDLFLTAAKRLGVAAEDCLVVEDAVVGLVAARSAGMRTLAVTTTTPAPELHVADAVVGDLSAVEFEIVAGRVSVHQLPENGQP